MCFSLLPPVDPYIGKIINYREISFTSFSIIDPNRGKRIFALRRLFSSQKVKLSVIISIHAPLPLCILVAEWFYSLPFQVLLARHTMQNYIEEASERDQLKRKRKPSKLRFLKDSIGYTHSFRIIMELRKLFS